MAELDWALVHLKKHIEKTHGIREMEKGSRDGEVAIHGGVVHCPGGHRSWTVSVLDGQIKIYCTGCKRCFKVGAYEVYEIKNVSVGVK